MSHINNVQEALNLLNGKLTRTLAPNTLLVYTCSSDVEGFNCASLVFHDQVIAKWNNAGFTVVKPVYLVAHNKLSKTTVKRLNTFCPKNQSFSSNKNGTFVSVDGGIATKVW